MMLFLMVSQSRGYASLIELTLAHTVVIDAVGCHAYSLEGLWTFLNPLGLII